MCSFSKVLASKCIPILRIKSNPASLKTRASSQRSKSSKNRRKHEKKKYSTKEGSAFEDIALVAALHELITQIYAKVADVGRLTRALCHHDKTATAKEVQRNFEILLSDIFLRESKIWIESVSESVDDGDPHQFGPEATTADIIQSKAQQKGPTVPYHLLGNSLSIDSLSYGYFKLL